VSQTNQSFGVVPEWLVGGSQALLHADLLAPERKSGESPGMHSHANSWLHS